MDVERVTRIAAVGDLHVKKTSKGALAPLLETLAARADVLLLCGDLTDYGMKEEAEILAKELSVVSMPIAAVLGNHDHESGTPEIVADILRESGVHMLDGEAIELAGIGIAGVKGFVGGFGRGTLGPWGESAIKAFVQQTIEEALKLEQALARLRTTRKIAMMHYAPIRATVEGEPTEIFPWLGCGRLEEPLHRHPVDAVVHGHAHHGSPEGVTENGIPVYNVAMPLMKMRSDGAEFVRIIELAREEAAAAE